jgi:hypothetical protein
MVVWEHSVSLGGVNRWAVEGDGASAPETDWLEPFFELAD